MKRIEDEDEVQGPNVRGRTPMKLFCPPCHVAGDFIDENNFISTIARVHAQV